MPNQKPPPATPRVGGRYVDQEGKRILRVTKLEPLNTLFRQVQGRIELADHSVHDYSTTEITFADIWRPAE